MPSLANFNVKSTEKESLKISLLLKGLLASVIITVLAFILLSLILANTNFPQRLITPSVVVTTIISVLTAGSVSTRGIRNKGWLNGSIVGLVYMILLYLISSLVYNNFSIDRYVITMAAIGIMAGAIGGILGINTTKTVKSSKYKHIGG
ncbi:MAG: TIGR04086 family membrane protein [Clostridia bacterium]|nr:TIGR04086 family membrane protein [Clostridia bacterium]